MSLLDAYRLDNLVKCIKDVDSNKIEGSIVEVGVFQGGSLNIICQNTTRPVMGFDTFEGMPETGALDQHKKGDFVASFDVVKSRLAHHKNCKLFKGIFPHDFQRIDLGKIALIHIDVDIFSSVQQSFGHVWKMVPVGGYFIFDDYAAKSCAGAKVAVNELIGDFASELLIVDRVQCQLVLQKTEPNGPGRW